MGLRFYKVDPGGWSLDLFRKYFSVYCYGPAYAARDGIWLRVYVGKRKLLELGRRR